MKHCVIQQTAFSTCEEVPGSVPVSLSDRKDPVVCPKPRRLGISNASAATDHPSVRSLIWQLSHQAELCESKVGRDTLDSFLTEGGYDVEQSCTQVDSSPLFFCGSPPSRVANPIIHDARFGDEKLSPFSPVTPITPPSGGCVWANFGNKPAVRIEGFDCLDRDRRHCSIPALA
uniref:Uncharacterized protein n=1 Tax=Rhizophora mucronata TaxID=61149 RepID=A0A2P2JX02_RHIMU